MHEHDMEKLLYEFLSHIHVQYCKIHPGSNTSLFQAIVGLLLKHINSPWAQTAILWAVH